MDTLAGNREHYQGPLSGLPSLLLRSFFAQFLINPFGLLSLPALVACLRRPTFPRSLLVASAIVTLAACYAFELFYNHNPDLARS